VKYLEGKARDKDVFYIPGDAPDKILSGLVRLPEGYFSGLYDEVIGKQVWAIYTTRPRS